MISTRAFRGVFIIFHRRNFFSRAKIKIISRQTFCVSRPKTGINHDGGKLLKKSRHLGNAESDWRKIYSNKEIFYYADEICSKLCSHEHFKKLSEYLRPNVEQGYVKRSEYLLPLIKKKFVTLR